MYPMLYVPKPFSFPLLRFVTLAFFFHAFFFQGPWTHSIRLFLFQMAASKLRSAFWRDRTEAVSHGAAVFKSGCKLLIASVMVVGRWEIVGSLLFLTALAVDQKSIIGSPEIPNSSLHAWDCKGLGHPVLSTNCISVSSLSSKLSPDLKSKENLGKLGCVAPPNK